MIKIIKPPKALPIHRVNGIVPYSIFLAGSIELGLAKNWQEEITDVIVEANKTTVYDAYIFNPRRDDWDSTWEQKGQNKPFFDQVSWELTALDIAEKIIMYFDENTKSPISLLELGLYANTKKLMVCCPDKFWRKGNVDIVCERYNIPVCTHLQSLLDEFKHNILK